MTPRSPRSDSHSWALDRVIQHLEHAGFECVITYYPHRHIHELWCRPISAGESRWLRLAVRAGTECEMPHRVTVDGRSYEYRRTRIHFNLHSWGAELKVKPDVWILVNRTDWRESLVVPAYQTKAKAISLLVDQQKRPRRSRYRQFTAAWDLISQEWEAINRRAA